VSPYVEPIRDRDLLIFGTDIKSKGKWVSQISSFLLFRTLPLNSF
jgi:hypothetical protein